MLNWFNQNAGAVQGIASLATAVLTAVLVAVTYRYTRLTHRLAKFAEDQLKASVEPPILDIAREIEPGSLLYKSGPESNCLRVSISVTNVGARPVKILDGTVIASVNGKDVGAGAIRGMKNQVLMPSPSEPAEAYSRILLSPNVDKISVRIKTLIKCTDLADISEHTYVMQPNGDIQHYSRFIQPEQQPLWKRISVMARRVRNRMDQLERG